MVELGKQSLSLLLSLVFASDASTDKSTNSSIKFICHVKTNVEKYEH